MPGWNGATGPDSRSIETIGCGLGSFLLPAAVPLRLVAVPGRLAAVPGRLAAVPGRLAAVPGRLEVVVGLGPVLEGEAVRGGSATATFLGEGWMPSTTAFVPADALLCWWMSSDSRNPLSRTGAWIAPPSSSVGPGEVSVPPSDLRFFFFLTLGIRAVETVTGFIA